MMALRRWFGRNRRSHGARINPDTESGRARALTTLARNDLVGDVPDAVDRLFDIGQIVTFEDGQHLIVEGAQDDDVYFLIAGSVRVLVNGVERDRRAAPEAVGDLAAASPGRARTADVIAVDGGVTALQVPGHAFSEILSRFSVVRDRHSAREKRLLHEKLDQMRQPVRQKHPPWWVISGAAALVSAVAAWVFMPRFGITGSEAIAGSALLGALAFVLTMNLDPIRVPLTLCWLSGVGAVTLLLYGGLQGRIGADAGAASGLTFSAVFGQQRSTGEVLVVAVVLMIFSGCMWVLHRRALSG